MKCYKNKSKIKKFVVYFCFAVVFILLLSFICFVILYNKYDLDKSKLQSINNGVIIYDSNRISSLQNTNRSITDIDELPTYVVDAFVTTEDKRFYNHSGYDLKRMIKAGLVNLKTNSKTQGASTISQQLIKNALLTNEKTFSRKIKEIILAIKLEKEYSKKEILEMYLNTIYFGSNAYGIENASYTYFNKSAKDLSLNEACCIAGIIKSPKQYSPKSNYDNSLKRRNVVATNLLNNKKINENDYSTMINDNIELHLNSAIDNSYEQSAIYEACELLNISERELINKQYQLVTFKDSELHNQVKTVNSNIINNSKEMYKTNLDSLSVVVNNKGHVLSYYENSNYSLHNLTRQPASILKPLAVYLPAIKHNILTPATKILDESINYSGYSPMNSDKQFHGYISVKNAVANSLNIPAVKILDCVGLKNAKECLDKLGINILNSDLNLSLALGATKNGIKLMDILSAYNTISNLGEYRGLCFIKEILDKNGNVIYKHTDFSEKVISSDNCFLLTEMLKETAKTGTAKRLNSLEIPVASKTGTASNGNVNTDLFNVSYTTEHTVLSWISNIKDNSLPENMLSSVHPTEINKQIFSYLYQNDKPKDFKKPTNVALLPYDLIEYEENNRIVAPTTNIERYIAYDYFKQDFPPVKMEIDSNISLNVDVDKFGAKLSFYAKRNQTYNVYKKINEQEYLLKEVSSRDDFVIIQDKDIFKTYEISYYIKDASNTLISDIVTIKPKDYLVNMLNNAIIDNKNWFV